MSEEEEDRMLEEAYSMSLESPEADSKLNAGTAAPNCQPKHTDLSKNSNGGSHKHRRNGSDDDDRGKRQHRSNDSQQRQQMEQQKKMSYLQMAKLGYQELVNAIIRPPRADYKVRSAIFGELSFIYLLQ
jgi:hypothetical protein